MAWVVGIDEAGYGPNLGPFVMSSVALRVPDDLAALSGWQLLRSAVRKACDDDDGRIPVDDSKALYGAATGLARLEAGVLAVLAPWLVPGGAALADFLGRLAPDSVPDIRGECWYRGDTRLPVEAEAGEAVASAGRFAAACDGAGATMGTVRSVVLCPARFNALLDRWETKSAVLVHGFTELLRRSRAELGTQERIAVFVDKHGGRNNYAAMLQDAVGDGMVVAVQESALRSHYRVLGVEPEITITFQPRADADHFTVALASMVSKYLRELFMGEFNRYWTGHVPDLAPTAGYPGDAGRFLGAIRPVMAKLGVSESVVWRRK
jgi:ribonuclease HII